MEQLLNVKVTYVVYRSDDGEFAIVSGYHNANPICLTGGLYPVAEGTTIDVNGEWKQHPKYGVQFEVHSYVECRPTDLVGIENYLKSGLIEGIGAVSARSIVKHFGADTFQVLDTNPDRLSEVDGIGPDRMSQIKLAWSEQQAMREVLLYLSAFGLSTTLTLRIYRKYREETIENINENPYCLAEDIEGISFQTADAIALAMGLSKSSYQRCRSGTLYYLSTIGRRGHCFATYTMALQGVCKLLTLPLNLIERALQHMSEAGDIVIEDGVRVYQKMYYAYENEIASDIKRICNIGREEKFTSPVTYDIEYNESQLQAIAGSIEHKFMVLTGEPGSGKTTTVKGIVDTYIGNGKKVLLASPTGRAAKVLSDSTDLEAKTIHRLLDYNPSQGYGYTDKNQLYGDVLVVDEISMVDIVLMRNLLRAVPDNMVVILVGDASQIPSVGPGNVLADIILSGVIPVYYLNQVFRQDEGSTIRQAAHNINKGLIPDLSNPSGAAFYFLRNLDEAQIADMIVKLRTEKLPKSHNINAVDDIHVIAPMYKGEAGVSKLNTLIQQALGTKYKNEAGVSDLFYSQALKAEREIADMSYSRALKEKEDEQEIANTPQKEADREIANTPQKEAEQKTSNLPYSQAVKNFWAEQDGIIPEIKYGAGVFRLGDKVIQTRNDYDKDVYNGSVGIIVGVNTGDRSIKVDFGSHVPVEYTSLELGDLELGYVTTVHKAQGSEYPIVIIPMVHTHAAMWYRKLLYTAVTRAKEMVILIGSENVLYTAIADIKSSERNTRLWKRLRN